MTTYNVHIYREMRLKLAGVEADTPESTDFAPLLVTQSHHEEVSMDAIETETVERDGRGFRIRSRIGAKWPPSL